MLHPQANGGLGFSVAGDAGHDALFLEGESIALWLRPCLDRSGAAVYGSLCGTLIVPPKRRFILESADVQLRATQSQYERRIQLVPLDFRIDEVEVGNGEPASTSSLVNRPYQLPGSWLGLRLLVSGDVNGPVELRLPRATIDGIPIAFPPISISPSPGETCVHFH